MLSLTTQLGQPLLTNICLFFVGDTPTNRSQHIQWIRNQSHVPIDSKEFETGYDALSACQRTPPHGILLNDQLPDMTGLDFLKEVSHALPPVQLPLIFLLGDATQEIAAQAIQFGAQDYFIKNTLSQEYLWRHIQQTVTQRATSWHIQALERQFNTIFQSSEDGLVVVNSDGLIRFLNPAAENLFQQSKEKLVGSVFGHPLIPDQTREITIRYDETQTKLVEMRVTHIEWENEPAYLIALRDLSERQKTAEERKRHEIERQFAQKQESLGVLAGGIAHDFNNLLMSIVTHAGLAIRSLATDSPAREHLQIIEKSGLRGGELANQMLAFAGQTRLDFQAINLHHLYKEMQPFLRSSVSKHITFTFNISADLPTIKGDRSQLQQLLMNIVINAAEAIGDQEGTIELSASAMDTSTQDLRHYYIMGDLPWGPCVTVKIRDTGCGIQLDLIPKIFDPFFSTKLPGRGLGLAALLGIVRGHGAAIAVHSLIGKGSEFVFIFPITKAPVQQSNPSLTVPNLPIGQATPSKVLVVDDEEEVRTACTLILKEIGLDTLVAQDGLAGEQIFEQYQADIALVLLDLTMPHVNGGKLAQKIRQRNTVVPILVSSGYPEEEAMKFFSHSGVHAYIQKPFQVETLIAKVQELIRIKVQNEK